MDSIVEKLGENDELDFKDSEEREAYGEDGKYPSLREVIIKQVSSLIEEGVTIEEEGQLFLFSVCQEVLKPYVVHESTSDQGEYSYIEKLDNPDLVVSLIS